MRLVVTMNLLAALLATAAGGEKRKPRDPVAAAEEHLRNLLLPKAGGKPLKHHSYPGPLETTVVSVAIEGAYPGSGVYHVVLDKEGVRYGTHGDKPLGALAQARGWFTKLPDEEQLIRLVNEGLFDGLMIVDMARPHSAAVVDGAIELRFVRRAFPTTAFDNVAIRIAASGAPTVEIRAVATAPETAAPSDPADALEALLKEKRFVEVGGAISKLRGSRDPKALAALAHTVAVTGDVIAGQALLAMGPTPEAARSLKAALSPLDADTRAHKISLIAEFHGAPFAAQLK